MRLPESQQKETLWGLVVPEAHGGIFAPMSAQMTRTAREAGHGLLFADPRAPDDPPEDVARRLEELAREYLARRIAGVFFMPLLLPPASMRINAKFVDALDRAGIPVILLDRDIYDYPRRSKYDLVDVANRRSAQAITEHLLGLGHRCIRYATHPEAASTATARIAGYEDALRDAGITPEPGWIHPVNIRDRAATEAMLRACRADAFVCLNDALAAHLIRALSEIGIRVPDDVAVVGFDDVDYATLVLVPLTTMRQPCEQIGAMAVRMMTERMREPTLPARQLTFACELIVRDSCGAARRDRAPAIRG